MGRESVAYLGYLYCRAEWWSTKDCNLAKFQSCGGWNVHGKGRKWTHTWKGILSLIWTLYFATLLGEWDFYFSHFHHFLEKIILTLSCWYALNSLEFVMRRPFVGWLGTLRRFWVFDFGGIMSGEGGCQYLEWIVDGPDILRLANNGYTKEKDR